MVEFNGLWFVDSPNYAQPSDLGRKPLNGVFSKFCIEGAVASQGSRLLRGYKNSAQTLRRLNFKNRSCEL
jgi:hypothetical protein